MRKNVTKRDKIKDQYIEKRELYETTFNETITYEVQDFISYSFIKKIATEIAHRAGINDKEIKLKLSADNYSIVMHATTVHASLMEAKNYNREIGGLSVNSGIVYRNKKQNLLDQDHYSIEFEFTRSTNYSHIALRVYGVSHERTTSQETLDWGNGAIRDLQTLQILDQKPEVGEPVINLQTGLVELWKKDATIQKVEVTNEVSTNGTTWKNIPKDPNPTLALIAVVVAIILAALGWIWFNK